MYIFTTERKRERTTRLLRNLGPIYFFLFLPSFHPLLIVRFKASLSSSTPTQSRFFFFIFSFLLADSSSSTVVSRHRRFLQTVSEPSLIKPCPPYFTVRIPRSPENFAFISRDMHQSVVSSFKYIEISFAVE